MIEKFISETNPSLELEFRDDETITIKVKGKEVFVGLFDPEISDMFHEALVRWSKKHTGEL